MNAVVKLDETYTVHDKMFKTVTLRAPTFKDIYTDGLGDPEEWQPTPNGSHLLITNYETIGKYAERLAIEPTFECLTGLSVSDSRKVAREIVGFFRVSAVRKTEDGDPKKTDDGSSSGSDSTLTA